MESPSEQRGKPAANTPKSRSAADYAAIEQAIQKSPRGRWFLAEFSRRNRNADTEMLVQAIARLERAFDRADGSAATPAQRSERPFESAGEAEAKLTALSERLERAVAGLSQCLDIADEAQAEIIASAEALHDTAWEMRERAVSDLHSEAIEGRVADIYAASAQQSLAAKRIESVLEGLRLILRDLSGASFADTEAPAKPVTSPAPDPDARDRQPASPLPVSPSPASRAAIPKAEDSKPDSSHEARPQAEPPRYADVAAAPLPGPSAIAAAGPIAEDRPEGEMKDAPEHDRSEASAQAILFG